MALPLSRQASSVTGIGADSGLLVLAVGCIKRQLVARSSRFNLQMDAAQFQNA
jgi:hypothetical protein